MRAADERRKESLLPYLNWKDYLRLYPDLVPHLPDHRAAVEHYNLHGFYEGRTHRWLTADESEKFSVQTYLELNRDFEHAVVLPSQEEYKNAVTHYLSSPNRSYTWEFLHPHGKLKWYGRVCNGSDRDSRATIKYIITIITIIIIISSRPFKRHQQPPTRSPSTG